MSTRSWLARIANQFVRRGEGDYHPGPWFLPVTGGWLPPVSARARTGGSAVMIRLGSSTQSAMVEACVSAYSQTVAMCPGDHWRLNDKNGRDRVKNSALSRILRHPNDYQSISDFMLNGTRSLYLTGQHLRAGAAQ